MECGERCSGGSRDILCLDDRFKFFLDSGSRDTDEGVDDMHGRAGTGFSIGNPCLMEISEEVGAFLDHPNGFDNRFFHLYWRSSRPSGQEHHVVGSHIGGLFG